MACVSHFVLRKDDTKSLQILDDALVDQMSFKQPCYLSRVLSLNGLPDGGKFIGAATL